MIELVIWVLGIIAVVYTIALLSDLTKAVERIERRLETDLPKLINILERLDRGER